MKDILKALIGDYKFTGDIMVDSIGLLNKHDKEIIAEHTERVAVQAKRLAEMFEEDSAAAEIAGLLHPWLVEANEELRRM